jgi:hypothetical protein
MKAATPQLARAMYLALWWQTALHTKWDVLCPQVFPKLRDFDKTRDYYATLPQLRGFGVLAMATGIVCEIVK